ncbi:MAG: DnaJ domain-containing protein [Bdellovibrionales bacterium]|nr:DnaJ domain-containing protein [Bdellovibrionales bacterium]
MRFPLLFLLALIFTASAVQNAHAERVITKDGVVHVEVMPKEQNHSSRGRTVVRVNFNFGPLFAQYPYSIRILLLLFAGIFISLYITGWFERVYHDFLIQEARFKAHIPGQQKILREKKSRFLDLTVTLLGQLALADGNFDKSEKEAAEAIMQHQLRLTVEAMARARKILASIESAENSFSETAREIFVLMKGDRGALSFVISLLEVISEADQQVLKIELDRIAAARRIFQLPEEEELEYSNSEDTLSRAYKTLGLPLGTRLKEVKKRYRELVKETHPDILSAKGVSEELMAAAKERFIKIQEAYEALSSTIS